MLPRVVKSEAGYVSDQIQLTASARVDASNKYKNKSGPRSRGGQ